MDQIAMCNTEIQSEEESVFISYGSAARMQALDVSKTLADCGIQYVTDKKHPDADNTLSTLTKTAIDNNEYYLLACTEACLENAWIQHEIDYAISRNKLLLFYLEHLNIKPQENALPALVTDNMARLAGYFAYSSPTQTELNLFIDTLLADRSWTKKEFSCSQQGSTQAWHCKSSDSDSEQSTTKGPSLVLSDEDKSQCSQLVEVEISHGDNNTGVLKLGYAVTDTTPTESYVMHYESRLRGVLVEPRKQGDLAIGIRSYSMDDDSESLRAGTPTIDDQMYGRDLYGWHVSATFWKKALETLSQKLSA